MIAERKFNLRGESRVPPYYYFLLWLILFSVIVFVTMVMVDQGFLAKVMEADKSYISLIVMAIFFAASLYAAGQILRVSRTLLRAEYLLDEGRSAERGVGKETSLVDDYIIEMSNARRAVSQQADGIDQANYIFEIYVDELRAPGEMISFVVDVLIRLGLIGTIIGFILMLQSFVTGPAPSAENIQELLITMSSGMGTALYTTFAGLVASTLLGIQQILLSRNVERVVAALIRISDIRVEAETISKPLAAGGLEG